MYLYSIDVGWCCIFQLHSRVVCGTRSVLFYGRCGRFYALSACIVALFGWVTLFNKEANSRGLFGFFKAFRIYSGESGAVGFSIILPCVFGFSIIVSVSVGYTLIAFDGRVSLQVNSCCVWFYAYIVKVFGVAKKYCTLS